MEKAIVLLVLLKMTPGSYSEKHLGSSSPSSKKNQDGLVGIFPVVGTLNLAPLRGKVNFHGLTKKAMKDKDLATRNNAKTNGKKQNSNRTIL